MRFGAVLKKDGSTEMGEDAVLDRRVAVRLVPTRFADAQELRAMFAIATSCATLASPRRKSKPEVTPKVLGDAKASTCSAEQAQVNRPAATGVRQKGCTGGSG